MLYDWGGVNKILFHQINYWINYKSEVANLLHKISMPFDYRSFGVIVIFISYTQWKKSKSIPTDLLASYIAIVFIFTSLKFTVNMPRPYCNSIFYYTILDTMHERCFSSFASAHVAFSVLLSNHFRRFLFLPSVVGLSRIGTAMHYPSDVFYAAIISMTIIFCVRKFLNPILQKINPSFV